MLELELMVLDIYLLHRLTLCLWNNLNYEDKKLVTRHYTGCDTRCFNPEHLKPGTDRDNALDRIRDGNHYNANKKECPTHKIPYITTITKTGPNRGMIRRKCKLCVIRDNLNRKYK